MALVKTPDGTYRFAVYRPCDRFTLQRYGSLNRTETQPNGSIVKFVVTDQLDNSIMIIDEEDADRLDVLLIRCLTQQAPASEIEEHLAQIFDVICPVEHSAQ